MFNPSRDQARLFFFDAWEKYHATAPLTALETIAVELISSHPEYQSLFDDRERNVGKDFAPEDGVVNPFLHLSMHMAIREQVSIDQPVGIRAEHQRLSQKLDSPLDAEHEMMDCLGEMIWRAQRSATAPDPAVYFACLRRK